MARVREFDDLAVVRSARLVFWQNGYVATSLADLQDATGLSRSSLYAAYGSKRGLFERAARSYLGEVIAPLLAPMQRDGAGLDEVADYFLAVGFFIRDSVSPAGGRGCLMLNTAMELEEIDADAAEMVADYRQLVRSAIRSALGTAPDADDQADILTATLLGVMATARFNRPAAVLTAERMAAELRPVGDGRREGDSAPAR